MALKIVESTMRGLNGEGIKEVRYESRTQTITVLTVGAAIKSWAVKDKNGVMQPIVLTYQDPHDYLKNIKMLGANIGPYAGRIYPPDFKLEGATFQLEKNFKDHANLHSGKDNIATKHFRVRLLDEETAVFTTKLDKNTHAFRGDMTITITMRFLKNGLDIIYETKADETTLANLTNHTYFNLNGHAQASVLNHHLKIPASHVGKLDAYNIPQSLMSVKDTPFDFNQAKPLKSSVEALIDTPQKGLDHPFVLTGESIQLFSPTTNIILWVKTDYDAVVVYTNNVIEDVSYATGDQDAVFKGICLECQHLPNDIHMQKSPKSILLKNSTKTRHIQYRVAAG